MNKVFVFAAVTAAVSAPALSHAGFTAQTNLFGIANTDNGAPGANVGDSFTTSAPGTFLSYLADTANDPQLTGGDLANFRFTLTGTVTSVVGNVVNYTGTYRIYYGPGDITVSAGTSLLTATFAAGNTATFNGSIVQTQGPANPAFGDFGARYNNNPAIITGTYVGDLANPLSASAELTIRQNAPAAVPAPAAMLAFGVGLIRRRRKA